MKSILCVDDETVVVDLLTHLLQAQGYDVTGTEDALSTRKLVDRCPYDLVILDVMMPERSGLEVFDELKAAYGELPMLFVTGVQQAFDWDCREKTERWRNKFIDGLTDVLYKPFRRGDLLDKVDGLVGPP